MTMIKDLSGVHKLITDLFRTPTTAEEWEEYALTEEQLAFFHANGYLAGIRMLEEWQLVRLRRELEQVAEPDHPGHSLYYEFHSNESSDPSTVLFHALGAWRIGKGFHDVLWNPRFLVPASQLLGNKAVRFWHDQLFCKPPKQGGVVAWHQDYSYWTRTRPMEHLTCWCGLDDSTAANGCLQYIPGSHRWGLLEKPVLAGDFMSVRSHLSPEQQKSFQPVPVETKAGEAIFHHPLALHGSGPNTSKNPRRAFVINVFADGVCSDSDDELLFGVPPVPRGRKMEGQFFPLLYEPGGFASV